MRLNLNFSGRINGNCGRLARAIEGEVIDVGQLNLHACRGCQYECFQEPERCPFIGDDLKALYERILDADEVVFFIPNFCNYPCADLFVFNERSCCVFGNNTELLNRFLAIPKRFVVISNTGTEHFQQFFDEMLVAEPPARTLFLSAREYGCRSLDGNLADVPEVLEKLYSFLDS